MRTFPQPFEKITENKDFSCNYDQKKSAFQGNKDWVETLNEKADNTIRVYD